MSRTGIRNLLEKLEDVEPANVEMFLILKSTESEQVPIRRAHIGARVGKFFLQNAKNALESKLRHDDLIVAEYEPLLNPDSETILYEEVRDVPRLREILEGMDRHGLAAFEPADVDKLRGYAIRFTKEIIAFKKYSATKLLQKNKLIAIFGEDGTFTELRGTAAAMDKSIDSITTRNHLLILSSTDAFESLFEHVQVMAAYVESHVAKLSSTGVVDDVTNLMTYCTTDNFKRKKLFRILNRPELLAKLTPKKLADAAKRHKLDLIFDSKHRAVLDTPQRARDFLKLVDEDFYRGEYTDQEFAAHSKIAR